MASLSTASCFTQEGRKLCLSVSSARATSLRPGNGGLLTKLPASSSHSRRLSLLLRVAASKRTSERRRSVVEEPLEEDAADDDEEYVLPELFGEEPDFWEGPQFDILGFVIQYLWAFGILIALGGCFTAVRFYNNGATDFKETSVYKESMESQGFVEVPSDSKVFDEPPSQDAPPVVQESSN